MNKEKDQKVFEKLLKRWEKERIGNWELIGYDKDDSEFWGYWRGAVRKCKKLEELIKPILINEDEYREVQMGLFLLFIDMFYFYEGGKRTNKDFNLYLHKALNENLYWAFGFIDHLQQFKKK